ncbi:MAG: hypothetical protein WCA77_06690, partial [Thermoplasmata archaeon]
LDEAENLSERLYIIEEGKVLVEGTATELKRQMGGTLRVSIPGAAANAESFASFGGVAQEGDGLTIITGPERLVEILNFAIVQRLTATVGPVTLEEAFLRVVGRSINED